MKEQVIRYLAAMLMVSLSSVTQSNAAMLMLPGQYTNVDLGATYTAASGGIVVGDVKSLAFDKFDPTLGTLTSVQVAFSSLGGWFLGVSASGGEPASGSALLDFTLVLTVDGWTGDVLNTGNTHSIDCDSPTGSCTDAIFGQPGSTEDYYYVLSSLSDPAALANFVASGASSTFGARVDVNLGLYIDSCSGSCSGNAHYVLNGQRIPGGEGARYPEVVITYEYAEAAIPEPTTLALFGLGLAGLSAVRRKKLAA